MPTRKSRAIKIRVQKVSPGKLLEGALVGREQRISRVIALAAGLGFLVGGGILGYLFFAGNPLSQEIAPEIIVPEQEQQASPETTPRPPEQMAEPEPRVEILKVLILDTPTGFLNLRAGPGTGYPKIGQVSPGEVYDLVSETPQNGGWFEIRLLDARTGWVTKRHAQVK